MVKVEKLAGLEEIRPSRELFIRKVTIGSKEQDEEFQMVCLHGICGSEAQYMSLINSLDSRLENIHVCVSVLLLDCVGCGQSPPINNWNAYSNAEVMADLEAVFEKHLSKSIPTVIAGHSYGPSTFLPLFRRLKEEKGSLPINVVGTILIGTSLRFPELPIRNGGHPLMVLPTSVLNALQKSMTNAFVGMAVYPDHKELKEEVREASNNNDMYVAKCYHRHSCWATEEDLAPVKELPSLVIHGLYDHVIPVECGRKIAKLLPQSEFCSIKKASHLVLMEQPDMVAHHIAYFMQKLNFS